MQALKSWFCSGARLTAPLASAPLPRSQLAKSFHTTVACLKQRFMGEVLSTSMNKSVVVAVHRLQAHPKYHKIMKLRSKIMAHAEYDEYELGDKVIIEQCRPLSKRKAFMVLRHIDEEKEAKLVEQRAEKQRLRDIRREERKAYFEEQARQQALREEEIARRLSSE